MIGFLVRGLLRDRQRSLFPVLVVTIGVWITVFMQAYLHGVLTDMIDYNARFSSGHVKITTRSMAENTSQEANDLALLEITVLVDRLQRDFPDMTWVPRIHFGGILDVPGEMGETRAQGMIMGMGVDLLHSETRETETLNIASSLVQGHLPQHPGEILISDGLAEKLHLEPGQSVSLLSSTMYGGMSIYNFTLAGTVRFGIQAMDRGAIIADISDIRAALDMADAAGEILGFFPQRKYNDPLARAIASDFNQRYSNPDDEFSPFMATLRKTSGLGEYLDIADKMGLIIIGIFATVMSLVLWNIGLLGGLRRYGEVGIRLAIGEPKGHIYRSMIYESLAVGLAGSVFGTALGLICAYWLQTVGLDISGLMKNIHMMVPTVFRASITPETWYIGFIPGTMATVLGTALAGIGIYRRQTAQLFKELEV
ncbi:MAG: ABC transporter permease [Fidelibacterota bacterium]